MSNSQTSHQKVAEVEAAPTQTLLILGASSDLAARLLLPGLGSLLARSDVGDLWVVGTGTTDWDNDRWRRLLADSFSQGNASTAQAAAVVTRARYVRAEVTAERDLRSLLKTCRGRVVIYFALPPAVTMDACELLTRMELPGGTRLVMEKPFGTDATGARALNELLARLVHEDRVYRVDHYLGMSTVLNILGLRFANRMLEPLLNADQVSHVEIVSDETLALEGRAGYYDHTGALVDVIQSHLLQVLSLLTMEAPSTLRAKDFRDCKAQVLRATRVWNDDPARFSRRARYTAGKIDGRPLPSYVDEEGVDAARATETLADVVFAVDTWRWAGVPFRMRTGKALAVSRKEVVVTFKEPPLVPSGLSGYQRPDRLRIGLGPPDKLRLDLNINGPGDPSVIEPVTLEADFGPGDLPPYGEVLKGVFEDDPTLSVRGDTAVDSWLIVEPVLRAWRADEIGLQEYAAGSEGPEDGLDLSTLGGRT